MNGMRVWVAVSVLCVAAVAVAGPVPKSEAEDEAKALEKAWEVLLKANPAPHQPHGDDVTVAMLRLARSNRLVEFLEQKLIPVHITEKSAKKWLKDLGSDDEMVWKPAYENLFEQDPRLVMKLDDVWEAANEIGRLRLASMLMSDHPVEYGEYYRSKYASATLSKRRHGFAPPDVPSWTVEFKAIRGLRGVTDHEWPILLDVKQHGLGAWRRVAVACLLLEADGSKGATALLRRMADGHDEATPTKVAKSSLERLKK